jgi:hypothetical protein
LFDAGLIKVGYVTGTPYSETVAEEMIATGLLKDLGNAELRNRVAELPVWIDGARSWELDSRGSLQAAVAEAAKRHKRQLRARGTGCQSNSEERLY